jgi:hypothetical protein
MDWGSGVMRFGGVMYMSFRRVISFERVWWVGVLQTFCGMLKTCRKMFVARWAGSYGGLLQFLGSE